MRKDPTRASCENGGSVSQVELLWHVARFEEVIRFISNGNGGESKELFSNETASHTQTSEPSLAVDVSTLHLGDVSDDVHSSDGVAGIISELVNRDEIKVLQSDAFTGEQKMRRLLAINPAYAGKEIPAVGDPARRHVRHDSWL